MVHRGSTVGLNLYSGSQYRYPPGDPYDLMDVDCADNDVLGVNTTDESSAVSPFVGNRNCLGVTKVAGGWAGAPGPVPGPFLPLSIGSRSRRGHQSPLPRFVLE